MKPLLLIPLLLATAIVVAPAAQAHPGPTDRFGGHYCRPSGGGPFDCTRFGVEVGEYHCEQDPCLQRLRDIAETWCVHGVPVPTRSDLTGLYPEEPFTRPIEVRRLGGGDHVLEIDRRYEPKVVPPGDCLTRDPSVELALLPDDVAEHLAANGGERPHGAADPVSGPVRAEAASVGIERIALDPGPSRVPFAAAGAALLLFGAAVLRRRDRGHGPAWEAHRGS